MPHRSQYEAGTLVTDGLVVTFITVKLDLGGLLQCTKCNSPPIRGQCINHHIPLYWFLTERFVCLQKD